MEELLWKIIEQSKGNKVYCESREQYVRFVELLAQQSEETIFQLKHEWDKIIVGMRTEEFEKLHERSGGIVCAGDDGFYTDFASWLIAQGKELVEDFIKTGHQVVLDYIKKQDVFESDYLYECMGYAFADAGDARKNLVSPISDGKKVEAFLIELRQLLQKYGITEIEQADPEVTISQSRFDGLRFKMPNGEYLVNNNKISKYLGSEGQFPNRKHQYEDIADLNSME